MKRDYWVWGINPEPWRVPGFVPVAHGRGAKAVKDGKTEAFQEALADEIVAQNPTLKMHMRPLVVEFYFWRSTAFNMPADATNCQKAAEDALQGILYENDRTNRWVKSMICAQSPEQYPVILIRVSPWHDGLIPELPDRPVVTKWEDSDWTPPEKELF